MHNQLVSSLPQEFAFKAHSRFADRPEILNLANRLLYLTISTPRMACQCPGKVQM